MCERPLTEEQARLFNHPNDKKSTTKMQLSLKNFIKKRVRGSEGSAAQKSLSRGEIVAMRVHVLPDCPEQIEGVHDWLCWVEWRIREMVEVNEDYVLLVAARLEYAFYCFFNRTVRPYVLHAAAHMREEAKRAGDGEGSEGEKADGVREVKVIVAVCPQIGELRKASRRDVEKDPCSGDDGCELFTRDEAEGVFQGSRQNIEAMVEEEQEEEKTSLEPLPEDLTEY